jgi:hypothetical protein
MKVDETGNFGSIFKGRKTSNREAIVYSAVEWQVGLC